MTTNVSSYDLEALEEDEYRLDISFTLFKTEIIKSLDQCKFYMDLLTEKFVEVVFNKE